MINMLSWVSALWLAKTVLGCVALGAATILCLEAAARVFLPEKIAIWREPPFGGGDIQFISERPFQSLHGFPTFAPNETIRFVSYYPDDKGDVTIEYDCRYQTDKNGFVSNASDYVSQEVLLLGDSFTVGLGGCEWVSRLAPDILPRVYVAAHIGIGPVNWLQMADYFATVKNTRKILVVFITDDFFRRYGRITERNVDCLSRRGSCSGQWWYPIGENMQSLAAQRYAERYAKMGLKGNIKYYLPASYTLLKILFVGYVQRDQGWLKKNLEAIREIARKYDLRLVWVNERREISSPMDDTALVERELAGLDVQRCLIPYEGFMPRDNHPNRSGYEKLRSCVEQILRDW